MYGICEVTFKNSRGLTTAWIVLWSIISGIYEVLAKDFILRPYFLEYDLHLFLIISLL